MKQRNLCGRHAYVIRFLSRYFRRTGIYIATAILVALFCTMAAAGGQEKAAEAARGTISGRVTDAQDHVLAGAQVQIWSQDNLAIGRALTDAEGNYRSALIPQGTYTLSAGREGYENSKSEPIMIGAGESKRVDLVLHKKGSLQQSSQGAPAFFDEPKFTIAGVTDTSNLGGHASGMTGPTESLAKEVIAVSPKPGVPTANTAAERAARDLADRNSGDFRANYSTGKLLLDDGKPGDAIPYLIRASDLSPDNHDSSIALAQAYTGTREYAPARTLIRKMLAQSQSADLHHLLATVEEKSGNPVPAEREFQEAAKLDPSEANVFDWGMELLAHHATEPAIEIFKTGNGRFPQSARMLSGLAAAFYERGAYDEALQQACAASDLTPNDASPYLLLGKMQNADRGQSDAPLVRLERFVRLQPENAWANYYYALALWKRRKGPQDAATSTQVESLLQKAVRLDPHMAKAYFQLGVLYSEKNNLPQAIASYESAVRIDPQLVEAHYRLAQAYVASGQAEKSQQEIALYKQNAKAKAEAADRERREVQQFVYTMQPRPINETNR